MGTMYVGMGMPSEQVWGRRMWVWGCLVSRYGDEVKGYGYVGMRMPMGRLYKYRCVLWV